MKGNAYTIGFSAVLGTTCALLLTAAASVTAPYKQANARAEEARNILRALKVPLPEDATSAQVVEAREKYVQEKKLDSLTTYVYSDPQAEGQIKAIAVKFAGPGLWGPIKGFLALEPDMRTIRGIRFYEQEETPGLGGEIATPGFQNQFVGKSVVDESGDPGVVISSAGEPAPNKVDGISGATMTCDKVEAMLNEAVKKLLEEK